MECSPPGSSVHSIVRARILEGLPCPPPGDLPNPGVKFRSPVSPAWQAYTEPPGKPLNKGNQPFLILDVPFKAVLADKGVHGAREFTVRIGAWTKPISL